MNKSKYRPVLGLTVFIAEDYYTLPPENVKYFMEADYHSDFNIKKAIELIGTYDPQTQLVMHTPFSNNPINLVEISELQDFKGWNYWG